MKKFLACILILICVFAFGGCAAPQTADTRMGVYYLSNDGKELSLAAYPIEEENASKWAAKMAEALNTGAAVPSSGTGLFNGGIKVSDMSLYGTILTVDLNPAYESQNTARKLLVRAGITKTMTQHKDITAVAITVDGKPVYDSSGSEIGAMTATMYVDENNDDINNYRNTQMTLYFTNEQGQVLLPENRSVYYSLNTPVEQAVVNELIQGPSSLSLIRTLPVETNVLNVTIQDDICYVNFDESFLNNTLNTSPEVQIYSIVNSLYKACQVEKVAFSVNGSNQYILKDSLSLETVFSPNMDLVEK